MRPPNLVYEQCKLVNGPRGSRDRRSRRGSAERGHVETALDAMAARPPRGDGLRAGVELDAFWPIDVAVAEERLLPAAERLHSLAGRRRRLVDVPGDRRRADERH